MVKCAKPIVLTRINFHDAGRNNNMAEREILQDIIGNFAPDKFTRFFREKNRSFAPRQESFTHYNDEYFADGLKLGEVKFSESEKLVVCVFKASQPLSERSGKKAQYEKGKKILKDSQSDAGIFIFYDKDGNFRFSLIYPKAIGPRRQWSNFRRFTYFVSREFTNKTFLQRIGDGDFSSLEKIKDAFSVEKVTKEFYQDIANWYFWAVQHSIFPKDAEEEENGRNIAVIRLITRMIFIWFMREQGLVPKNLFEEKSISAMLKEISPESSTYYQAILQNLFFATLSTKKDDRKFRSKIRGYKGYNPDFGNQNVFRFQELFKNPENLKADFGDIPFLNGGLFECLDDKPNGIYIDGFTAVKKNQSNVPNILFFSGEKKVDLNAAYGTKSKTYKVRGLLDILSSFNFTIDENSPDDQDIALDPELLGRVFENLLASFNPETSTTARKATGSYYTPREIVDYMVTESLKAYFKTRLSVDSFLSLDGRGEGEGENEGNFNRIDVISNLDKKIDQLFSTGSEDNPFNKSESKRIVELIESVRIVDPAVGSGAFPMGALNKLVFILNKVDPGNELWKQAQLLAADTIPDPRIKQDTKNRIEEFFKGKNADYGRKLYLIQKCIYGVDIQQIAVEIAKLRFFISLLVDEKIDRDHPNGNWGIEPLPNLDFKIMQGNSLISEFLGIDFDNGQEKKDMYGQFEFGSENEDGGLIKEFERNKIDYQNESDKDKKTKLKEEVEDLMIKIFEAKLQKKYSELKPIEERAQGIPNLKIREEYIKTEKEKFSKKHGFDMENIEKQLREFTSKKKTKPFFPWKLYFAEVFEEKGGFDVVIANPPYVSHDKICDKSGIKSEYKSYNSFADLYCYFIELGLKIQGKNGILCYITSNSYLKSEYAFALRVLISRGNDILQIINIEDFQLFDSAIINTAILISQQKNSIRGGQSFIVNHIYDGNISFEDFVNKYKSDCSQENFEDKSWLLIPGSLMQIKKKIESAGKTLFERNTKIRLGLATGANEAFVIDENTRSKIIKQNPKSQQLIKPILRGRDIYRYGYRFNHAYILLTKNSVDVKKEYPAIYNYLNSFGEEFKKRGAKGKHWTNLRACDFFDDFKKEKIIWIELSDKNRFALSIDDIYLLNSAYFLLPPNGMPPKYLLAVLNSAVINFYLNLIAETSGMGTNRWINIFVKEFPIPEVKKIKEIKIIDSVDKILAITKSSDYLENLAKKEDDSFLE